MSNTYIVELYFNADDSVEKKLTVSDTTQALQALKDLIRDKDQLQYYVIVWGMDTERMGRPVQLFHTLDEGFDQIISPNVVKYLLEFGDIAKSLRRGGADTVDVLTALTLLTGSICGASEDVTKERYRELYDAFILRGEFIGVTVKDIIENP